MLAGIAAVVALGACQTEVTVGVDVERDGSGMVRATVALDEDALRRVPDLDEQLQVQDLEDAGWDVRGPNETDDGGAVIIATKPFADPAGAADAVDELSGETGPFQRFQVTRERSFLKTTTSFTGEVDLSAGLGGFSDADLQARLGGQPLGIDEAELERQIGSVLDQAFQVRVAVRMPGDVDANTVGDAGNGAIWTPKLGEKAGLEATAEAWNATNIAAAAVGAIAAVAFAVSTRRALRARRR